MQKNLRETVAGAALSLALLVGCKSEPSPEIPPQILSESDACGIAFVPYHYVPDGETILITPWEDQPEKRFVLLISQLYPGEWVTAMPTMEVEYEIQVCVTEDGKPVFRMIPPEEQTTQ